MEDYDDIVSDHSCNEEAYYSDQIDSDIEAELYGLIHHDTQDNSISLQDKSDSIECKSVSLHNKSGSIENNSILLQNSLGPIDDNSTSLKTDPVSSKDTVNSTKKLKTSVQKNIQNCRAPGKNSHQNVFCSDAIVNNNLYTSFESPVRKQKIQSNQVQRGNSKRNIDKATKRKSEVVSELLEKIQSKNIKSGHLENSVSKQKKNDLHHNSVMTEEISFVEVIDDSSDSDSDSSIIIVEPDQSNIETNITKETVVLSSDAEDSDSSMEKSLSQACQRKQTAIAKLNFSSNNKDPWHINSEDKFRTKKQSNRYHENAVVTCSKCQLKGHSAKFCSLPKAMKCFFCGNYHSGMNCKNKICIKCFQQGHDRRRCYIRHIERCELCRMRGHSERNCPDIWRRYHLTTSKGTIVKGNAHSRSPLYCYNCGSKGHYGAECMENRDRWSFPTWTSVVSYKNPISVFRKREERNFQERSNFDRTPVFWRKGNETFPKNPHIQKTKKKKKKKSPKTSANTNHQPTIGPRNTVQNEVYFPRTPKIIPTSSTVHFSKKKLKKFESKEDRLHRQQVMHQIGLQQRLGLPFPSTV